MLDQVITNGYLTISDPETSYHFGERHDGCNDVHITVVNDDFWIRILMSGDLGFSEAYMAGNMEVDSLKSVMDLWLDNQSGMIRLSPAVSRMVSAISGLSNAFLGQTHTQARLNAIASYDQSNQLFKEGGVLGDITSDGKSGDLEAAQLRKIHHVLQRARVQPGDRLLEFGTGWGGLAIEAARSYSCEVDTLTLSVEQKVLAEERVREARLEHRISIHLLDYRQIPAEFEKAFDAFVSIEMLEHVGSKYYNTYFKLVDYALKSKRATVVVSSSTFPESRYTGYQAEDFMRRYMWPNSCLPSATALITAAHSASQGRFTLEGVENHAAHYPRTLREWSRRLDAHLTRDLIAKDYPALKDVAEFDAFKRKWQYLFAYAGAGFAKGYITCHMLTFIRENDIPVTCS